MKASEFGIPPDPERWAYSINEEDFHGGFGTKEEAIAEGQASHPGLVIYVARASAPDIHGPDADYVIEQLACSAANECGEHADDYLSHHDVSQEARNELDDALEKLIGEWLTRHALWPTFFTCGGVEEIQPQEPK